MCHSGGGPLQHRPIMHLQVDTSSYKYFIFMNSSVRGPFIPVYGQVRWVKPCCSRASNCKLGMSPTRVETRTLLPRHGGGDDDAV